MDTSLDAASDCYRSIYNMLRTMPIPTSNAFAPPGTYDSRSYGLDPTSIPNGKIVVFSLPKSGNVWLVSLLRDYAGLEYIDPIVDVEKCGVGMSHLCYTEEIGNRTDFVHGVYLMRDIRDVIVSYYHNVQRSDWQVGFPHFHCNTIEQFYFEWFLPRVTLFHDIYRHAEIYSALGLPIVKYETLYDAPADEFERLLLRLGLKVDRKKIIEVIEKNDFSVLKKAGKKMEASVPAAHFRRGGYGNYVNELPKRVLQHINMRFRPLIEDWGYSI